MPRRIGRRACSSKCSPVQGQLSAVGLPVLTGGFSELRRKYQQRTLERRAGDGSGLVEWSRAVHGLCHPTNTLRRCRTLPPCLKCLVKSASSLELRLCRYIVTADEEHSGVQKHKLPDRNFRQGDVRGIHRDGTTLREYSNVALDVRAERHFHDVID